MAFSKRVLLLSSCTFTFFSARYAPNLLLGSGSYLKTVFALFAIQYCLQAFYIVLIYPFFLSPLRYLPQPPVCLPLSTVSESSSAVLSNSTTARHALIMIFLTWCRAATPCSATSHVSSRNPLVNRKETGSTMCLMMASYTTAGSSMSRG